MILYAGDEENVNKDTKNRFKQTIILKPTDKSLKITKHPKAHGNLHIGAFMTNRRNKKNEQ